MDLNVYADRWAWVVFDATVRQWLETECMSNAPMLDTFKNAFPTILCVVKRTEQRRAYEHEYQKRKKVEEKTV